VINTKHVSKGFFLFSAQNGLKLAGKLDRTIFLSKIHFVCQKRRQGGSKKDWKKFFPKKMFDIK